MRIISNILRWLLAFFAPPRKDLMVVFLCLVGATMMWFLSAMNKNYTTTIRCPVTYDFDNKDIVIVTPPPGKIEVNVSAGGWNLLKRSLLFTRNPVKLKIHNPTTADFIKGSDLLSIFKYYISELKVNSVETDTLFFDIQKRKDKVLTGRVNRHLIHMQENYRIVGPITINPGEFNVSGPDKLIDTIPRVFEISIDKDEINKPFSRDIKLDILNSDFVHFNPEKVRVSFNVERLVNKELEIPVNPVNFPRDSSAFLLQPSINVKFKIRESMADTVNSRSFLISADYKMTNKKNSTVMIEIKRVPDYVENFRPDTTSLKVGYGKKRKTF